MKKLPISVAALSLSLITIGCGDKKSTSVGDVKPVELSDIKNATFDDSASYYLGQGAALAYWSTAESDTSFNGADNAEAYMAGFKAGMEKMLSDEAYALGYQQGVNAVSQLQGMNKMLKTKLKPDVFAKGLAYGLQSENAIDKVKFNASMSIIDSRLSSIAQMQAGNQTNVNPQEEAFFEKNRNTPGIVQTESGLQYKTDKNGNGATPVLGDVITISMTAKDMNGQLIFTTENDSSKYVSFPYTAKNARYQGWFEAISTMKEGGKSTFYVPSYLGDGSLPHILEVELTKITKK